MILRLLLEIKMLMRLAQFVDGIFAPSLEQCKAKLGECLRSYNANMTDQNAMTLANMVATTLNGHGKKFETAGIIEAVLEDFNPVGHEKIPKNFYSRINMSYIALNHTKAGEPLKAKAREIIAEELDIIGQNIKGVLLPLIAAPQIDGMEGQSDATGLYIADLVRGYSTQVNLFLEKGNPTSEQKQRVLDAFSLHMFSTYDALRADFPTYMEGRFHITSRYNRLRNTYEKPRFHYPEERSFTEVLNPKHLSFGIDVNPDLQEAIETIKDHFDYRYEAPPAPKKSGIKPS